MRLRSEGFLIDREAVNFAPTCLIFVYVAEGRSVIAPYVPGQPVFHEKQLENGLYMGRIAFFRRVSIPRIYFFASSLTVSGRHFSPFAVHHHTP